MLKLMLSVLGGGVFWQSEIQKNESPCFNFCKLCRLVHNAASINLGM